MIAVAVEGLTAIVLLALTVVGSFAMLILAVSLLPILGMFGAAVYEGVEMIHEREPRDRRRRSTARPVTHRLGHPLPHH
jgi:hypothetical protein